VAAVATGSIRPGHDLCTHVDGLGIAVSAPVVESLTEQGVVKDAVSLGLTTDTN
jgi:hypothetical protein